MTEYKIRQGNIEDAEALADVETACFPPAEEIAARLSVYPSHFFLLYADGILTGFIDGMVTNEKDLRDEMYADASLHDEAGDWQMIFGLNTLPSYRRLGLAGRLIEAMKEDAKKQGRKGIVLTCKEELIHYYAKFGFENEGKSNSSHGNVTWYQMRLTF